MAAVGVGLRTRHGDGGLAVGGMALRQVAMKLTHRAAQVRLASGSPILVGLCGPQGAGKSTLAAQVERQLQALGLSAVALSIDDFYLTQAERSKLANDIHPLLAFRGPPGTHDVGLALDVIDALLNGEPVAVPRFDKGNDDRCKPALPPLVCGPVDVVILEGWCVGARAQSPGALRQPVNAVEAQEDADRVWRTYVNDALAGDYQSLFSRIALFAVLLAPSFDIVPRWRQQQEHALRRNSPSAQTMTDDEILHFVGLYERLTRHIALEAPSRADVLIRLDEQRVPVGAEGL